MRYWSGKDLFLTLVVFPYCYYCVLSPRLAPVYLEFYFRLPSEPAFKNESCIFNDAAISSGQMTASCGYNFLCAS